MDSTGSWNSRIRSTTRSLLQSFKRGSGIQTKTAEPTQNPDADVEADRNNDGAEDYGAEEDENANMEVSEPDEGEEYYAPSFRGDDANSAKSEPRDFDTFDPYTAVGPRPSKVSAMSDGKEEVPAQSSAFDDAAGDLDDEDDKEGSQAEQDTPDSASGTGEEAQPKDSEELSKATTSSPDADGDFGSEVGKLLEGVR
jgi:hypothetical protein